MWKLRTKIVKFDRTTIQGPFLEAQFGGYLAALKKNGKLLDLIDSTEMHIIFALMDIFQLHYIQMNSLQKSNSYQ